VLLGGYHSCSITDQNGDLKCWGRNFHGQVGNGRNIDVYTPTSVSLSGGSHIIRIALGYSSSCAIDALNVLQCWGDNFYGQLGLGDTSDCNAPKIVTVGTASNQIVEVALGDSHTCAIDASNGLYCWGSNSEGQLGIGSFTGSSPNPTPILVSLGGGASYAVHLALGGSHTCVIDNTNDLWCFGGNSWGQLGLGDNTWHNTPTIVPSLSPITGSSSFAVQIACGADHTCVVDNFNNLKCWGWNRFGQLGDGTTTDRPTPTTISLGTDSSYAKQIALGPYQTCAIDTSNQVKCWGWNNYGQLGDDSRINRYTPTIISLGASFAVQISLGLWHTCAYDNLGFLKCWGWNIAGQLGDGTRTNRLTPVTVQNL